MRGDRIVNTPYIANMTQEAPCTLLCDQQLNENEAATFVQRIKEEYSIHLYVFVLRFVHECYLPHFDKREIYTRYIMEVDICT